MALTQVSTDGVKDGSLLNADINASAAISKSKIENLINNNADNRVITGSGTANTLNSESGVTYDGSDFTISSGVLKLTDESSGSQFRLGTGNDFQIEHDGSNTYIYNLTNDLVIQNDANVKITAKTGGTQRFRFDSDGLKFGTDTAAANALDDYEEGTYTPTFVSTGASFSYNHQYGHYQKVGNTVHVSFYITLAQGSPLSGTTTNNLEIYVPFAATSATRYEAACCFSMIYKFNLNANSNQDIPLTGRLYSGRQGIELLAQFDDAAGYAYPAVKADQAGCGLAGSITYKVA